MLCLAARTPKSRKWRPGKPKDVLSVQFTQLLLRDNEGKPQVRKIVPAVASDRGSSGVKLWSRSEQMKGDESEEEKKNSLHLLTKSHQGPINHLYCFA